MKIKNLLLTLGLVSIAALGWYIVNNEGQESAAYVPRSDYNKVETGALGAVEYYESIKANVYTGQIEPEDILSMQLALKKIKLPQAKNDDIEWESMGPNNVGGRTRAILPLSDNPNSLIAGSVSGGLFRSDNGGLSWNLLEGFDSYLIVSSLAQLGNGALYAATGHSRESPDGNGRSGFIGRGLYVSNDNGVTWNVVSDFEPQPYNLNSDWANIDVIKADPLNPDKLWIGSNLGFYGYIHGSATLEDNQLFTVNISNDTVPVTNNIKDFDISQDGQTFIVVSGARVFISNDGGANFSHVNCSSCFSGLPTSFGTAEVVISRNNSDIMYMSVASGSNNSSFGFLQGAYATVNGGITWSVIAPPANSGGTLSQFTPFYNGATAQGWYDHMLTSVPSEETEQVILGGIRMWRWELTSATPGITAWEEVNANFTSGPGQPPSPIYVHSDIHTDAWDSQGRLFAGTDGGVFRSDNNGGFWTELVQDYVTTQYYAIAFNPIGQVLGGTQDNSSLWLNLEGSNPKYATALIGGDGVGCEISQYFPDYMFMSQQRGTIFRSTDRGQSVSLMQGLINPGNASSDFTTDMALHENPNNENSEVFVEYSPAIDSPWLVYYENDTITPAGDTIIARIPAGSEIQIDAANNDYVLPYTVQEDINFYSYFQRLDPDSNILEFHDIADTALIQEKPQFLFAAGYSQGTFVTRQPLKTNGTPQFYQVSENTNSGQVTAMEWSPDGDHLYVGFSNGQLVRYSNFNDAWTEDELEYDSPDYALERRVIHSGSGAVTDIEVDYSQGRGDDASERVAISIGGYQGSGKIRVSDQAASVSGIGTFEDVWNVPAEFIGMPAYSVVMDIDNPELLLAGTEYGIWYSGDNGETWSEANNGEMVRVPVFDLRQQKREPWNVSNNGVVYAGTHGRGIFKTNYLLTPTSVEDVTDEVPVLNELKVFPNPVTSRASVSFDLGTTADIEMYIYSIDGRLIEAFQEQRVGAGVNRQIDFDASDYSIGQYILQLRVGDDWNSAKFVVTR